MRANRVEVSHNHATPLLIRGTNVPDQLLDDVLGLGIGVGAVADTVLLVHGQVLWVTIHSGGGGEDNLLDITFVHGLDKVDAANDIVVIV